MLISLITKKKASNARYIVQNFLRSLNKLLLKYFEYIYIYFFFICIVKQLLHGRYLDIAHLTRMCFKGFVY